MKRHSVLNKKESIRDNKSFLEIQGLRYYFSNTVSNNKNFSLGPLSLQIKRGELLSILGPSGSGKTTFLRLLSGLEVPTEGRISVNNKVLYDKETFVQPEERYIGMMFQDHALFPHLRVNENIVFGISSLSKHDRKRRLYELEKLLSLQGCLDRFPHDLSGGQQQRVALARTLAPNPNLILLDEPLCNIDAELRSTLAQELRDILKETGVTALWVTHNQTEALDLADRVIVLNEGKIQQVDTPWNLYNNPRTRFVANFIGHAVFIEGKRQENSILTEIGSVDCPPCLNQYNKMKLMLRPDDIIAVPHDDGIGVVCKRQFLGAMQLYSIQLPSNQIILSYQQPQINWSIGVKVQVILKLKIVVAFPSE